MRKYLPRFFRLFRFLGLLKKPSVLAGAGLIILLAALLPLSTPLTIELKADPKLEKQKEFSKKSDQILSYLKKYESQTLWRIPLKQIIQDIEKMSLGLELYAHRKYPRRLMIGLNEKKTALLLLKRGSDFYSVSYDGSLGIKKETQTLADVPILRGASFESDKNLRLKVLELLKPIPKQGAVFSIENISEILYDKKQKSFLIYLSTRPLAVKLNSPPLNQKIKNIEFVLEYLKKEEKSHSLIDARANKKIIVKKKI